MTLRSVSVPAMCAVLTVGLVNFTAVSDALACRTMIGDFVWSDSNGNGIQDAGEAGINGVTLRLIHNSTTPAQTQDPRTTTTANHPVTGAPGWYQFDRITCGERYTVSVVGPPAGYSATTVGAAGSTADNDSNNHGGTAVGPYPWSETPPPADLSFDFGYTPPCTGSIGDLVWIDANHNGQQDAGEPVVAGAIVSLDSNAPVLTDVNGNYLFSGLCAGTYKVSVQIPAGYEVTTHDVGDDGTDSDGQSDGLGNSSVNVTLPTNNTNDLTNDFGFWQPPTQQVGAGTPGYWKNHPEAWPVDTLTIGGVSYTKEQVLAIMDLPDGDKTITLFRALVAAKLNVLSGTDSSCISSTITAADAWMATYGPVGSRVKASSYAWRVGEPLYRTLDNYNNGMLCAPARD